MHPYYCWSNSRRGILNSLHFDFFVVNQLSPVSFLLTLIGLDRNPLAAQLFSAFTTLLVLPLQSPPVDNVLHL